MPAMSYVQNSTSRYSCMSPFLNSNGNTGHSTEMATGMKHGQSQNFFWGCWISGVLYSVGFCIEFGPIFLQFRLFNIKEFILEGRVGTRKPHKYTHNIKC